MRYINVNTGQYPLTEADIRNSLPNTSFNLPFNPPSNYKCVFDVPLPFFNEMTQELVEDSPSLTSKGHWEREWDVVALSAQVIAAKQQAKEARETAIIHAKIETLWAAGDKYTSGYISGVAIGILAIGVISSRPKALAVSAWSSRIWTEYYQRKALISLTSTENLDFSMFGPIPHSIPELQQELGL
jgi:hypothetical protein